MDEGSLSGDADRCWGAVRARDAAADGLFVYAVKTTGIYCRPGCPARTAKRENVSFFATCDAAARAGYRACRRCRPDAAPAETARADRVAQACRLIDAAEDLPKLGGLATALGVSPAHFHRQFKAATGMTPNAYAQAQRATRTRHALSNPDQTVTAAIYDAGFNANSRFYATSTKVLA